MRHIIKKKKYNVKRNFKKLNKSVNVLYYRNEVGVEACFSRRKKVKQLFISQFGVCYSILRKKSDCVTLTELQDINLTILLRFSITKKITKNFFSILRKETLRKECELQAIQNLNLELFFYSVVRKKIIARFKLYKLEF